MNTRNHENAPRDRAIWIVANIVTHGVSLHEVDDYAAEGEGGGCLTCCDPYEGYAKWDEASQDWLDISGMSIRVHYAAELILLEWKELTERAQDAPAEEISVQANVYYFASQGGFFACFTTWHTPTRQRYADITEGPFATQVEAVSRLTALILNASVNHPELKEAA